MKNQQTSNVGVEIWREIYNMYLCIKTSLSAKALIVIDGRRPSERNCSLRALEESGNQAYVWRKERIRIRGNVKIIRGIHLNVK